MTTTGSQTRASEVPRATGEPQHLAFIDALRGWAFLNVLVVHVQQIAGLPPGVAQFGRAANYGVQLFFVVSAVTLIMSFRSRLHRDRRPVAAFFLRRLFRIAPLFWLAIPTYLAFFGMGPNESAPGGLHAPQVISTALFLHGWHPTSINSVVPGGWSIAVEMNFYLLFPLCFYLLTNLRRSVITCIVALPVSVAISVPTRRWLETSFDEGLIQRFTYYWLPREMPIFLLGFILFFLMQESKEAGSLLARHRGLLGILPEVSVVLLLAMGYASDHLPLAYFWFSCGFVLLALGLSVRPVAAVVNPVTRYIGKVSYSAYIGHFLVLGVVGKPLARALLSLSTPLPSLLTFAVVYVVCAAGAVLLSSATYRFIETPGQNLGKALIDRLEFGPRR
jgi:peptidoglycan/LPS O-acetylase OafA/YrhL